MKIYENVVIGNFLYILGLFDGAGIGPSARTRRAVSLLQQTPLDKSIADVLVQSPSSIFIIEFKRKGASEKKEDSKKDNLQIALKDLPELTQFSKEIHWYVKSEVVAEQLTLEIVPYLGTAEDISLTSLEDFVEKLVDRRVTPHHLSASEKYLRTLRLASKIAKGKGKGEASSGTIVFLARSEAGFRHVVLNDLTDIFKVHTELIATTTEPEDEARASYSDDALSSEFVDDSTSASPSFKPR